MFEDEVKNFWVNFNFIFDKEATLKILDVYYLLTRFRASEIRCLLTQV